MSSLTLVNFDIRTSIVDQQTADLILKEKWEFITIHFYLKVTVVQQTSSNNYFARTQSSDWFIVGFFAEIEKNKTQIVEKGKKNVIVI